MAKLSNICQSLLLEYFSLSKAMTCTTQKGPQRDFNSFSFSTSWDFACNFIMSQRPHYCELQETIRIVVTATCRECDELIASCYNLIMMPCHKFSTAYHVIPLTLKMDLKQTPKQSQTLRFGSQSNSLQSQLLCDRLCQNPGSEAYLFWDHIHPDPKFAELGPCLCFQNSSAVWSCWRWHAIDPRQERDMQLSLGLGLCLQWPALWKHLQPLLWDWLILPPTGLPKMSYNASPVCLDTAGYSSFKGGRRF